MERWPAAHTSPAPGKTRPRTWGILSPAAHSLPRAPEARAWKGVNAQAPDEMRPGEDIDRQDSYAKSSHESIIKSPASQEKQTTSRVGGQFAGKK